MSALSFIHKYQNGLKFLVKGTCCSLLYRGDSVELIKFYKTDTWLTSDRVSAPSLDQILFKCWTVASAKTAFNGFCFFEPVFVTIKQGLPFNYRDAQHNHNQHEDSQHNHNQHNAAQHNHNQHNDAHLNDIQHKDNQYEKKNLTVSKGSLSTTTCGADCCYADYPLC